MPFFVKSKGSSTRGKKRGGSARDHRNVKSKRGHPTTHGTAEERIMSNLGREEIESSSDDEQQQQVKRWKSDNAEPEQSEDELETPHEKKERMAQEYIRELEENRLEKSAAGDEDAPIEQQLREEVLEAAGKLFRRVARHYTGADGHRITVLQCKKFQHKTLTCVTVSPKDNTIFSASLDGSIVKYSLTGARLGVIRSYKQEPDTTEPRHDKEVLALAVSSDGKYLVSGDGAGRMMVWDPETLAHLHTLEKKHRAAVTGLVFQRNTYNLFSCSRDRLIHSWSLDTMLFTEPVGGQSCGVEAVDALFRSSCISCGGADEFVIVFSILEQKQLRYIAKQTSVDGVKLLNENTFLTYGQDGSLCLWSTARKRPIQQLKVAHGYRQEGLKQPHWITALATLVNTDLVASGSSDGFIRLWRVDEARGGKLHSLTRIAVPAGCINSLEFTSDGRTLVAALGRTHKRGRWFVEKKAKNCVLVINFTNVKSIASVVSLKRYETASAGAAAEGSSDSEDGQGEMVNGGTSSQHAANGSINEGEESHEDNEEEENDDDEESDDDDADGSNLHNDTVNGSADETNLMDQHNGGSDDTDDHDQESSLSGSD